MPSRFAAALLVVLSGVTFAPAAEPRDDVLRLAPPDAALVVVVQNAREHVRDLAASPFAEWLPTSTLGKQLPGVGDLKSLTGGLTPILTQLGTTPDELLDDVLGDAIAFAYSPGAKQADERAVFIIRPRKPETLKRIVERINDGQTKSKELTGVSEHTHKGETYFERKKAAGASEFYCFRGSAFAFSTSEVDIKAVIARDKEQKDTPELIAKVKRLGVDRAAVFMLVQPRALDAELTAKIGTLNGGERAVLEKFRDVWSATDDLAVYLTLDRDLEVGVAVRFDAGKLPAWSRGWLTGAKTPSALWSVIPEDALIAAGGRFKASELLELIQAVLPDDGKKALTALMADSLGPVLGRDKLPVVLSALGPDWAFWVEAPKGDGVFPVVVSAVRVEGESAKKPLLQGAEFGFQTFRVLYNGGHTDQVELVQTKDGDVTITTLVNDKGFPPGFRPSFALKGGFLIVTSDPDAIRRFKPPTSVPTPSSDVLVARFSATATRSYIQSHGPKLAKLVGEEKELMMLFSQLPQLLEPIDRAELFIRGDDAGLRIAMKIKMVKSLKK